MMASLWVSEPYKMNKTKNKRTLLCPSHRSTGARLLGVRQHDGTISMLPAPLLINEEDFANTPERSFRFVSDCSHNGCTQWTGKDCGIASRIVQFLNEIQPADTIPVCSIRNRCRWHHQQGYEACRICPYIITDITTEELDNYFLARQ